MTTLHGRTQTALLVIDVQNGVLADNAGEHPGRRRQDSGRSFTRR